MDGQTTIFDLLYPKYKIKKKIRTIELFGGYGSQLMAIKRLTNNVEQWKLCEWAIKSIQAYKDVHFTDDDKDYSKDLSIKEIKEYLFKKGISSNYNEPMSESQVNRLNEKQARTIYNNIKATHNLVNIQQVKGEDLEIKDTDKYDYILTYSFPCQDLSLAGKGKGFDDTSTRSGMLWEVERILSECKKLGTLPQILLMENVPMIHSEANNNNDNFNKWQLRLEELGYSNYWQDLIATDYGIPQTRNRTFMISILGDYSYTFPQPIPLKLKLKDMLEDQVDEKYFLSDKMIDFFTHNEERQKESGNGFRFNVSDGNVIAKTITTRAGSRMDDNFIIPKVIGGIGLKDSNNGTQWKQQNRVYDDNVSIAVTTCFNPYYKNDLRIRKLTPKECFRLQGVKDEDFNKVKKNQSDSSLYHLAGDSIVVNVLMAIFKELL